MDTTATAFHFSPSRPLGRTGVVVTALGIGDVADRSVALDGCVRTVKRALDAGLNLIDTAPAYEDGCSEQIVGKALEGWESLAAHRDPSLPRLSVEECVQYALTCNPDVALLDLGFANEQDAAFAAASSFAPLPTHRLKQIRERAREAVQGKGDCWWNPSTT